MTEPWYLTECHCMHGIQCHACFTEEQRQLGGGWPPWFVPSKMTTALNARVARGLHPFGLELGPEASTCGSCVHLARREFSKSYLKCAIARQTRGPATDVRAKWRGCSKWEARP